MTTDYGVQRYSPSVPLFGSAIGSVVQDPYEPETWTDITPRCKAAGMDLDPKVRVLELRITDMRTGWGQQDDKIKASTCSFMNCYRRHLILPPLITTTTLGTAMNQGAMFYAHIRSGPGTPTTSNPGLTGADNALVMGGGNAGGNVFALFTETTAVSPVPLAVNPGTTDVVVSISALVGSPTGANYQVVFGMSNGVAARASTQAGDQGSGGAGTQTNMHANTANCWAILPTNINASTPGQGGHLIYAGTTMYYLSNASAVTAAPTATMTGLPGGGTGVGVDALQKNFLNRAHWLWPKANSTTSAFSSAQDPKPTFDWVTTNLEGTGPEILPTTLSRVRGGVLWNHQAIRWDGMRLTRFDGETEYDMKVMEGRESNSDYRWGISNVTVNGSELYVWIIRMDMTVAAGTIGNDELNIEKYLADGVYVNYGSRMLNTLNLSGVSTSLNRETINGEVDLVHQYSMGIPISRQTGFAHFNQYNSTKWTRVWFPPEGVNPYLHFNQTGTNDEFAQAWDAGPATVVSNKFPIPNYHGLPAVAVGCSASEMDIAAGGTGTTVTMYWHQQTATGHTTTGAMSEVFGPTDPIDRQTRFWADNTSSFTLGQFRISVIQGTDTHKTPNVLPAIYYVMVFLDGKVRKPIDAGFNPGEGWVLP